jgi:kumamolisin
VAAQRIAAYYDFPPHVKGHGQTIGLIELGGGFARADLKAALGNKLPSIAVVSVDGQQNEPFNAAELRRKWQALTVPAKRPLTAAQTKALAASADEVLSIIETTMDIELAATLAPAAKFVVYFAPETFHGKYHAFTAAIADRKHAPSVVTCSFGLREDLVPAGYAHAINFVLQAASLKGITFCVSTGDSGSGPEAGTPPIVQFPASSPYVLACGGTTLHLERRSERAWQEITFGRLMASGGGFSRINRRPLWANPAQQRFRNRGRGIPDVSSKADVNGGYRIVVAGMKMGMGGTSAAAPLWAALLARINEALGTRVGFITPWLYAHAGKPAIRDIRHGGTGVYKCVGHGWDPCTGLGSPTGVALLRRMRPIKNSPTDVSSK